MEWADKRALELREERKHARVVVDASAGEEIDHHLTHRRSCRHLTIFLPQRLLPLPLPLSLPLPCHLPRTLALVCHSLPSPPISLPPALALPVTLPPLCL